MSDYLKIVMRNVEPVRVSDAATSQSGQTMTFRYLPILNNPRSGKE